MDIRIGLITKIDKHPDADRRAHGGGADVGRTTAALQPRLQLTGALRGPASDAHPLPDL